MPPHTAPRVSIVMPAYNEAARIEPALDELYTWLRDAGAADAADVHEVLVVDDGSSDTTADVVLAWAARLDPFDVPLRMLREPRRGKGGAVRAGMLAAKGDAVVFTDADLATPPDQIPLLVQALTEHDVALGCRVQPDGSDRRASQPRHRRLLGRLFRGVAAALVTGPVPDTQCGFKGFRAAVAHDLFSRQRIEGIVFDVEIIHLARRCGYSLVNVPVMWSDKRGSRMRVRPVLALRVLVDLLRIPLYHRHEARRAASPRPTLN